MILVLALGAALVLGIWVAGLIDWRRMVLGLLCFMPFAGVPILLSSHSALALLAKDLVFVVPLYLSLFVFRLSDLRLVHIPRGVAISMLLFGAIVLLQVLNPWVPNLTVAAIGTKVWLFYWPLVLVAGAMVREPEDHVRLLRVMVALALVPTTVGLMQWFLSATVGYQAAISGFYGKAAESATQGFNTFDYGGNYFRIPSTFSFPTQYFGYLLSMIVASYVLKEIDGSAKWRRFARLTFYYVTIGAFLSGSRAAFVFVPLLIALMYLVDGRLKGFLAGSIMIPLVLLGALNLGGLDPLAIVGATSKLSGTYSQEFLIESQYKALEYVPFGFGTGTNTGPARYAYPDEQYPADDLPFNTESYYTKSIVELGFAGLIGVIALFATLITAGLRMRILCRDAHGKTAAAAYTSFLILIAGMSFKGFQLDVDPVNVYFWLFAGFLFKLPYLRAQPAPRPSRVPYAAQRVAMMRRPAPRAPR